MTHDQLRSICETAQLDPRTVGALLYREPLAPATRRRVQQAAKMHGIAMPRDFFADDSRRPVAE